MIKHYHIVLDVIGPVHIGDGKEIQKKDLIFDRSHQRALVMDAMKIYKGLGYSNKQESYSKFLASANGNLQSWFKDMGISYNQYQDWIQYETYMHPDQMKNMRHIKTCIKDAYGCPYIPGSSLKGALRTIFISKWIRKAKMGNDSHGIEEIASDLYRQLQGKSSMHELRSILIRQANALETRLWKADKQTGKDTWQDDYSRGIVVSDSDPLACSDLMIAEKIDVSEKNKTPREARIPLLREAILPKSQVRFQVGLDTKKLLLDDNFSIEDLDDVISGYHTNYYDVFTKHFSEHVVFGPYFYLGGGSGFYSKTVLYELLSVFRNGQFNYSRSAEVAEKWMNASFKNHKHLGDAKKLGYSPRKLKLTEDDDGKVEMGLVQLNLTRSRELAI